MNEEVKYISYEEALSVYAKMIDASDGGFDGVRDEGGIRAALEFVQNDMYYPNFSDKLCSLVYKFCSGHYFNDGNKRIALTLGAYFLYKIHTSGKLQYSCDKWSPSSIMWLHPTLTKIYFIVL